MSEEHDERCEEIEQEITAISDKYSDYIESITIKWKEECSDDTN